MYPGKSELPRGYAIINELHQRGELKVFGGYGAPLDIRKAACSGIPLPQHQYNETCHEHGCGHALQQLFTAAEAANHQFAGFFGMGCDCFAF